MTDKIMKSRHDAGEEEESEHDADEDREIRALCRRTRNKTKRSNLGAMIRTPSTCEETRDRIRSKEPLQHCLGWMTLTRCLYGSKNLGIGEDATIGDGDPIDKS